MEEERLQKYMASCGVASRRACEEIIRSGRVRVNGKTASLGMSVDPGSDWVEVDGKRIRRESRRVWIMLYKPRGVVSTSSDPQNRKTVQDCVKGVPERLFHVGRLDINSEGLILLTNDGERANKMMHPKYRVEKTYYAVCDGKLTAQEIASLTNGVELEDGMTAPAKIRSVRENRDGNTSFLIVIHEGRNRQVRRMLEAVGHRTLRLKREKYGPLELDGMKPGEWRYLTEEEIESLDRIR
ncbi:MAG: rRNA pseudouridine synthase [Clostridia bacterium]|nr:rRNA pseudouridine synthase [Clostridia bacterium]